MQKTRQFFFVVMLMLAAIVPSMSIAQQMPPIPVDPEVRIGKLDCGLTYYIRNNNYPENRVNFYIAQRVGSIQEEESQRGLAHFLEHMAFNGSEHFNGEGKGIIDYTRSLGVNFGGDLNAYTSIAETVYNINDVPSTRQSALDSCLLILKDWSNGLLLTDEESKIDQHGHRFARHRPAPYPHLQALLAGCPLPLGIKGSFLAKIWALLLLPDIGSYKDYFIGKCALQRLCS